MTAELAREAREAAHFTNQTGTPPLGIADLLTRCAAALDGAPASAQESARFGQFATEPLPKVPDGYSAPLDGRNTRQLIAERDGAPAAPDGWRPIETAPRYQWVILGTVGDWVGEAMLRGDGDNARWRWKEGDWVHPNHTPLGWQPLPEPINAAPTPAPEPTRDEVGLTAQDYEAIDRVAEEDAGLNTDVQALARRAENWMANGVIKRVLSGAFSPAEIKMLSDVIAALKAAQSPPTAPPDVVGLATELLALAEHGGSRKWTRDDLERAMLAHIHRHPTDSPFDGGTHPMSEFLTFCRDHAGTICRALTGQAGEKGER